MNWVIFANTLKVLGTFAIAIAVAWYGLCWIERKFGTTTSVWTAIVMSCLATATLLGTVL